MAITKKQRGYVRSIGEPLIPKLNFSVGHKDVHEVATFPDPDKLKAYVQAENEDPACYDAFFKLQEARGSKNRLEAAKKLDIVRWAFYKKWSKKYLNKSFHPKKDKQTPLDDIPV